MKLNKQDLIGKVFGKLTVLEASHRRASNGSVLYKCKCECGGETYTTAYNLKSGHTKSCGCTRKEKFTKHVNSIRNDLSGAEFGRLKAIKPIGSDKYRNIIWECVCDCGNVLNVLSQNLTSGNTTSCGCICKENIKKENAKNFVEDTNVAIIKNLIKDNKSNITASGVKGVGWDKKRNKWRSYIIFKGKHYHLGYFLDLENAKEVRKEAEKKLFSEFLDWYENEYKK